MRKRTFALHLMLDPVFKRFPFYVEVLSVEVNENPATWPIQNHPRRCLKVRAQPPNQILDLPWGVGDLGVMLSCPGFKDDVYVVSPPEAFNAVVTLKPELPRRVRPMDGRLFREYVKRAAEENIAE